MLMIERDYTDNSLHMYFKYSAKNMNSNNTSPRFLKRGIPLHISESQTNLSFYLNILSNCAIIIICISTLL